MVTDKERVRIVLFVLRIIWGKFFSSERSAKLFLRKSEKRPAEINQEEV